MTMRKGNSTRGLACDHTEASHAETHPGSDRHDCDYVDWRDSLVPIAEAEADALCLEPVGGTVEQKRAWSEKWDRVFHKAMARLVSDPFMNARLEPGKVLQ